MADPEGIADVLRLALLTDDKDSVRRVFREHRDLVMGAARGELGEVYKSKALPVVIKLLEEEQTQQQVKQPPEAAPALASTSDNALQAAAGLRVHREPAAPPPKQPSSASSTPGADRPGATPAESSHEQGGRQDADAGAAETVKSIIVFDGGAATLPPLDQSHGHAEAKSERSSPVPRSPSSVSSVKSAEAGSEPFRCASCLRAGLPCFASPILTDQPDTCLRCSLRAIVCEPLSGRERTPSKSIAAPQELQRPSAAADTSIAASQELQRPSAAADTCAEGSQNDMGTLLEGVRRLNALMARGVQVAGIVSELNAAVRGALQTADHALGSRAIERRPGSLQAPTARAATATAPSPPLPSSAQRRTHGDPQGRSMGGKGSPVDEP
ncbi:hypothetical protein GGG16DRAFT_119174 [Schizophyllum commune]